MSKRNALIVARSALGLLGLSAIGTQLAVQLQQGFSLVNFFSYFTNLANLFAGVVLLLGALHLLQRREPNATDDLVRGASVVGMALVGVVFGALLRDVDLGALLPWVNFVLHYFMPVAVVAEWLYQPPTSILRLQQLGYWLIFPALYLTYSLIRGATVGFYAYPFFNPAKSGGYGGVALYCLAMAVAFLLMGGVLIIVANALRRRVPSQGAASVVSDK